MATLPAYEALLSEFDTDETYTDETWEIDWVNKEIKTSRISGRDAVMQAIYMILNTEVRKWPIYSPMYGTEVGSYIGLPKDIVLGRLQYAITEALLRDDRIASVNGFLFSAPERGAVAVQFTVTTTTSGTMTITEEVTIS